MSVNVSIAAISYDGDQIVMRVNFRDTSYAVIFNKKTNIATPLKWSAFVKMAAEEVKKVCNVSSNMSKEDRVRAALDTALMGGRVQLDLVEDIFKYFRRSE